MITSELSQLEKNDRIIKFAYLFIFAQIVASLLLQSHILINRDMAIHLDVANKMLAGSRLYTDIVLTNFPAPYYFRIPPAWLAKCFDLNLITVNHFYNNFFLCSCMLLCWHILKPTSLGNRNRLLNAGFLNIICFVLFIYPLSGISELGQKEHSILLFSLPYVIYCIRRIENINISRSLTGFIYILLAFACFFKPFYITMFVFTEVYNAYQKRSWKCLFSSYNFLFVILIATYLFWTLQLTPFKTTVVPLMPLYWAWTNKTLTKSILYFPIISTALCILFFMMRFALSNSETELKKPALAILLIVCACAIAVLVQDKISFGYHRLTMNSYMFIFMFMLWYNIVRHHKIFSAKYLKFSFVIILFIASLFINIFDISKAYHKASLYREELEEISTYIEGNKNIYLFNQVMPEAIIMKGWNYNNRYYAIWPLIGIDNIKAGNFSKFYSIEKLNEMHDELLANMLNDIKISNPATIILTDATPAEDFMNNSWFKSYFSSFYLAKEMQLHYNSNSNDIKIYIFKKTNDTSTIKKNSRILITGGAGFIGSHLALELSEICSEVMILDSYTKGRQNIITKDNVRYLEADLATMSDDAMASALEGIDILYHLAAEKHSTYGITNSQRVFDVNIAGTERLYNAAAKAGVKKIIFSSSLYAYGRKELPEMYESDVPAPNTIYGISKLAGEHLLRTIAAENNSIEFTALRFFFVYGRGIGSYSNDFSMGYRSVILKHFERILKGEPPIIYGNGRQSLDYVHVNDIVKALKLAPDAAAAKGQTINLSSGRYISIAELTEKIKKIAGYSGNTIYEAADKTENTIRCGNNALAKKLLGWQPSISMDAGLQEIYEWMKT